MLDSYTIGQFILSALIFLLIITGSWKHSYTTTLTVFCTSIALHFYKIGYYDYCYWLLISVSVLITIRAMLHKQKDRLIKA